jgi:predicted DNA-binding transcriptional regulator AlpA
MAIKFGALSAPVAQTRRPPPVDLTLPGRLRAEDVQTILRIGRTWFNRGVKSGTYPAPDYIEGRARFWKHSTILAFIENGEVSK